MVTRATRSSKGAETRLATSRSTPAAAWWAAAARLPSSSTPSSAPAAPWQWMSTSPFTLVDATPSTAPDAWPHRSAGYGPVLVDVGELWQRVLPVDEVALGGRPLVVVLVASLVAVGVGPVWSVLRLAVTLVHELGHAGVGVLCGRRFTGFVLRGDMSGHAVTVGPARGLGRVATTWAGYPAPAVVGAAVAWLAVRGWAPTVLTVVLLVLVAALLRARSVLTAVVVLAVGAATGWLWWAGSDGLHAQVLVGAGIVLVVGAWRHLGAVAGSRDPAASDPAVLARLTPVPRLLWVATFGIVCAAATWVVVGTVLPAL